MVLLSSSDSKFLSNQPAFNLKSTQNTMKSSSDLMGRLGLVVLFTCNHCPYAIALWNRLLRDFK
ncbi:MAG: thioredoxin family protein, partial [Candidatus Margulisiibacteriota bacterium]|nr:thioredoxin family protein [Candidatus Margulisiibacteriota bacterium]